MKTRCPHCQTLYNIDEKTLKNADNAAVCCRCHQLFIAEPLAEETKIDDTPISVDTPTIFIPAEEQTNSNQKELDQIALEIEAIAHEVEKQQEPDEDWNFIAQSHAADPTPLPFNEPERLEDLLPREINQSPAFTSTAPHPTASENRLGSKLILLFLSLLALAQLTWLSRGYLMDQTWSKQTMTQLCEWADCNLPSENRAGRFNIVSRDLKPSIEHPGSLELNLIFTNDSDRPRSLPDLQLSLLDHRDVLQAQRRFSAEEYLYPETPTNQTIDSGKTIEINLLLQDPDANIAGFKLDFF